MDQFFTSPIRATCSPATLRGWVHRSRGLADCGLRFGIGAGILVRRLTPANGQTPLSPGLAQSPTQPATSADNSAVTTPIPGSDKYADSNSSLNAGNLTPSFSLSSSQIIDILQQNPDLVLELKSKWPIACRSRACRSMPTRSRTRCSMTCLPERRPACKHHQLSPRAWICYRRRSPDRGIRYQWCERRDWYCAARSPADWRHKYTEGSGGIRPESGS